MPVFTVDKMHLAREKARVDAEHYKSIKMAEANKLRFTPEYLEYTKWQAVANNTKVLLYWSQLALGTFGKQFARD
jgi:hypothetical protein